MHRRPYSPPFGLGNIEEIGLRHRHWNGKHPNLPNFAVLPESRFVVCRALAGGYIFSYPFLSISDSSAKNQVPVLGFVLAVDKSNKSASIFEVGEMCFGLHGKLFTKPGLFVLEKDKSKQQDAESNKAKTGEDAASSEDAGRD